MDETWSEKPGDGLKKLDSASPAKNKLTKMVDSPAKKIGAIVLTIIAVLAIIGISLMVRSGSSSRGSENGHAAQQIAVHQPYRVGWITVTDSYGPTIKIDSDKGENIKIVSGEQTPEPVKVLVMINGTREFSMDLGFGDGTVYSDQGQVFSKSFRLRDRSQISKTLVYVLYDYGTQPPDNWRLEAIRQKNGC